MRRKSMHGQAESGRMTASRWMIVFAVLIAVALGLSGCGRKGPPKHPEGSDYPKTYPQD